LRLGWAWREVLVRLRMISRTGRFLLTSGKRREMLAAAVLSRPSWSVKTGNANVVQYPKRGEVSALCQPCEIAGERHE